jgi:hypothetical protein
MIDVLYPRRGAGGGLSVKYSDVCVWKVLAELFQQT